MLSMSVMPLIICSISIVTIGGMTPQLIETGELLSIITNEDTNDNRLMRSRYFVMVQGVF